MPFHPSGLFLGLLIFLLLFPDGITQAPASSDNPGPAAGMTELPSPRSPNASGEVTAVATPQVTVRVVTREQAARQPAMAPEGETKKPAAKEAWNDFAGIKKYLGKYPFESADRDRRVGRRLRQLFAENYPLYKEISGVQFPIEGNDNFIVIQGCMPRNCDSHNVIVMLWVDGFSQAVTTEDYLRSTYYGPSPAGPADVEREKRFLDWIRRTEILSACKDNIEFIEAALRRRW
jgi:hypothetical protein